MPVPAENKDTKQPSPSEVAAWLQNYPVRIAPEIPAWQSGNHPSMGDKLVGFIKAGFGALSELPQLPTRWSQLMELKQATGELAPTQATKEWLATSNQGGLQQLVEVVHAVEHLEPAKFKQEWLSAPAKEQGYFSFALPQAFVDRVQAVVSALPAKLLAGTISDRQLSSELRVVIDPQLAQEIFHDDDVSKGQLHAAVNTLGGTAFNSAGEQHSRLRKDIAFYGTPVETARALTKRGPALTAALVETMEKLNKSNSQIDAVTLLHRFTLALFAETYFPQLQMADKQAKQVRSKPEEVFGAGAAARMTDGVTHWLAEAYYNRGTNSLNSVFATAFLAYAEQLATKAAFANNPRELEFIDRVVLMAYEAQSYELLFNNLMSAVAAGTDTVTQVSLEALMGVMQPESEQRVLIEAEFVALHQNYPELLAKLSRHNFNLTEEEWKIITQYCQGLTRPASDKEGELRRYVKRVADASAPVALTFKARVEDGREVTYLVPLKLLAHDSDITAFGVEGSHSICTGQSQATTTIAFLTLMASFSGYTMEVPSPLPKKKTGVVSTYAELMVRFKKMNGEQQ